MKRFIIPVAVVASLAISLSAISPSAQDSAAPEAEIPGLTTPDKDSDKSMIEDGMRMFLEGLLKETQPALRDMRELTGRLGPQLRSFAEEMGPALVDILKDIEDLSVYHAPEKLPNGDIIIRRKTPESDPQIPELPAPDTNGDIHI